MAYVFSTSQSSQAAAITNTQVPMPDHQTGDLVVYFSSTESGAGTTSGAGSTGAWTAITGTGHVVHTDATSSCFYRIMTSSSEVLFLTTTDGSTQFIVCIREANVATPFDGVTPVHASVAASVTPVSASVTSTTADCLTIYFISNGSVAAGQVHSPPGVMTIGSADSTGAAAAAGTAGAAWYFQRTAGATPTPTWFASSSVTYSRCTFVIRQLSGGTRVPAYIDDVSSPAELLHPGFTISTTNWGGGNVTMTGSLTNPANTVQIKAVNTTFAAAAVLADTGINPYANAIGSAAQTASTIFYGYEITYSTARDASAAGNVIMGAFIASTPKVASYGLGNQNQGGGVFRIASSTTAHATYQVLSQDSRPNTEGRYIFGVQAGFTGSVMSDATQGTAVTTTAVTANQIFCNFPSFTGRLLLCELYIVKPHIIAGGSSDYPVNTSSMVEIGKSFRLPVIQQQGGAGLLSFSPIQIGGGDDVNFQINGGILQFPKRFDANTFELNWHANDNHVGISYNGNSGDTIKHTNSLITSATPFYWEIHSSSNSSATWDFTGLSIYNGTVTLRSAANAGFVRMSFTACPFVTVSGCTVTSSTFGSNPKIIATSSTLPSSNFSGNTQINAWASTISSSAFTSIPTSGRGFDADATTAVTSSTVNTTTIAARNTFTQLSSTNFDGTFATTAFTGSGSSGHAIEVDLYNLNVPVRLATTVGGTMETSFANAQVIDGVALVTGDRLLIKNQSDQSENGIYIVTADVPTRATDMNAWAEVPNITVAVTAGTTNAGSTWECTSAAGGTLDTTAITFVTAVKHTTLTNVRLATTANSTLATTFENGDTIDGVALATGDRILIKDQSSAFENGIYTVNATGAPTRTTDSAFWQQLLEAKVQVTAGTVNTGTAWVSTTASGGTMGVTSVTYIAYKQYVVRAATTTAGTLASDFQNGDTIDGVALVTGDRILIKDQAAPSDNGIYVVTTGTPTRATDMDEWGEVPGQVTMVAAGTVNAQTSWKCTSAHGGTLGSTAITFIKHVALDVRVATTTAGTLASSFENGDTVNGVVLATGNRILIKNQTAPAENGIYTVNASGAPTRATDMDAWAEVPDIIVKALEGTTDSRVYWDCTSAAGGTLNTTAITFVEYNVYSFTGNTFTSYGATDTTSAAIYNNTGGRLTLNIGGGGGTPTIRNGYGATTVINNTVTLTVTVLDKADNGPIKLAQVAIYRTSDDVQLMNEDTETVTTGAFVVGVLYRIVNVGDTNFTLIGAASNTVGVVFTATGVGGGTTGTATNGIAIDTSFNYVSNTPIYVRIRKSLAGETKYVPLSTTGTITATGYTLTVTMTQDTNA